MALRFNGTDGNLSLGAALRTTLPQSIVMYAGGASPKGDFFLHRQLGSGDASFHGQFISGGNVAYTGTGDSKTATATGTWPTSSFAIFGFVFGSTSSRKLYYNSATPGVDTASQSTDASTFNSFTIGDISATPTANAARADIAEVHFFSTELTDANMTALLGGTKPEDIAGWIDGWQLKNTTDLTSMGGTRTLTLNGGVTNSALTHPVSRVALPVLSAPSGTVTSNVAATITHTTDTPSTGNTHYLRRTGGSAASAATIIATGESQATGGTGSQSRSVTLLGGTANQFIDIAQAGPSNVITVGPLSTATALSSPTGAATGTTTATAGFTTDRAVSAGFPAYFLTLPSATAAPADAAALIANGATVSQTTGGTTPTRAITGLTAATAYRTHMAQPGSNVVSSAPYTTDAAGTAPTITVQPANQTVTAGATATFSVTATGSGLTYQWRRNGTNIGSATSSSYTTPATTVSGGSANNGDVYSVVVTGDTAPAATSSNATLTVNAATGPTLPAVATDATGSARRLNQTTRMVVEPFTTIEALGTGARTIATGTTDAVTGEITLTGLASGTYAVFRFFPSTGATIQGVSFRLVVVP